MAVVIEPSDLAVYFLYDSDLFINNPGQFWLAMNENKAGKAGLVKEEPEEEAEVKSARGSGSKVSVVGRKKLARALRSSCIQKNSYSRDSPFHPFFCRLYETEMFCVTSVDSLINAGFASVALALFTFFRPTPFFLFTIMLEAPRTSQAQVFNRAVLLFIMWFWLAVLFTVLVFLGILLVASRHIRKRNVLMLHPWGLLLMYLDVFIWLFLTIVIHAEVESWREVRPAFLITMDHPYVFFLFIYFEVICFACLYYFYATFFIAAELTVIERFFP